MIDFILPQESNREDVLSFYGEIEKSGGVYENSLYNADEDVVVKRYWIKLDGACANFCGAF